MAKPAHMGPTPPGSSAGFAIPYLRSVPPPPRHLLVARHGQSTWNAEGRWQGQADPPLSALGEEQARVAAKQLADAPPFDLVVTSDLRRAMRTGALVIDSLSLDCPHIIEPLLREF